MGMDVFGTNPSSKDGKYFRNNIWWWHPLAEYVTMIAPDETAACKCWHDNSGDGLGEDDAIALADKLQHEIDNGRCAQYALSHGTAGTSKVEDENIAFLNEHISVLNIGFGTGQLSAEPAEPIHHFSVENVQEFATFLRSCGGFEIH